MDSCLSRLIESTVRKKTRYGAQVLHASKIELKYGTLVRYSSKCEVRSTRILNVTSCHPWTLVFSNEVRKKKINLEQHIRLTTTLLEADIGFLGRQKRSQVAH